MAEKINLDALISREDLAITETNTRGRRKDSVSSVDLQVNEFFFLNINKPDFQRETTEWDYIKIANFISSFLNNELIPAVILWQSTAGNIFVIDGAHRLSALIAWINNDYGDGIISRKVYNGNIPDEQIKIAEKARKYIEKKLGSYQTFKDALQNPNLYKEETVKVARMLSSAAIQLQWVEGDVSSAERSFFNINQQATPINKTELTLIESRKKPTCIAARAIMRSGLGHKYWAGFPKENQLEIESISNEIYSIMFLPKLQTPIKTLDIPMCGKHNHNALPIIFEFVNICNSDHNNNEDDIDGSLTVLHLKQTRKIIRMLNSNHASSLGLHPIVYFYARNGSFRVSAFYAFVLFVMELDQKRKKDLFIKHRKNFERIFYDNSDAVQIIARRKRSAKNGMAKVKDFFFEILNTLEKGVERDKVMDTIRAKKDYDFLPTNINFEENESEVDFNASQKSEIFIMSSIKTAPKCAICGGYLHKNSISIDHIERKQDGGIATLDNGQLSHPYCNTGYKN
ncbi:MAG: HNH endonuclease family protein [Bacillota bacterium]